MFDSQQIKADFPILQRTVNGKPLVYLDNAATSQKPLQVIEAISEYYRSHNANVHRGVHALADESTTAWEESRLTIASYFAAEPDELILVRNTTEAINGVAYGWADHNLHQGDVILTSLMEHHSNLVVWQQVSKRTGARLEYISLTPEGRLDLDDLEDKMDAFKTSVKLVALTHVSNTLGVVNPLETVLQLIKAKAPHARVLVDGAQSAPHLPINFASLSVDFFIFSGHKMLGPMGVGGLLVKKELLDKQELKPWLFGGGMISEVYCDKTTFHADSTELFTAGTPDVASAVGLAAACKYLNNIGMQQIAEYDSILVEYALEKLSEVRQLELVGPVTSQDGKLDRVGSVAFMYKGVHSHDVAQILDSEGVAVRSGHHCTMPLHTHFNWQATTRASFQIYNSQQDIDQLVDALEKVQKIFGV